LPGLAVRDGLIRHPFDLEFGVRTSGLVAGRYLASGHRNDRHATAYYAVAPSVFRSILVRWRRCRPQAPLDAFTFVDLGAGMGRALLLAAEFPFRAVIGVELHPLLARIAKRNLALWRAAERARAPMRLVCGDAAEFPLPAGPCVVFLFNPFGAPVLRRLLRSWSQSFSALAGQLDILYVNNEQEHVFAAQPGFARLFQGQIRRSHADAVADRRILTSQPEAEYAATPWEDCSVHRWVGTAKSGESRLRTSEIDSELRRGAETPIRSRRANGRGNAHREKNRAADHVGARR
jgi:SAM-dependent methyltransferase